MRCTSYSLALLHCFAFLFLMTSASLTFDYRWRTCNSASNYADGSTYSINLRRVMDHLAYNASLAGFGTYSYGQSPHTVYGLLQCIGNITQEDCQNCSKQAESELRNKCGNDFGGEIWMNYCFLRYSDSYFFSRLDIDGEYVGSGGRNQNILPSTNITRCLLSNLIDIASSNGGFASNSSSYELSNGDAGDVYGLVQCLRDISINDCRLCLSSAMQGIQKHCSYEGGCQAMLGSCTMQLELYPFYLPDIPPPPPSLPESLLRPKAESPVPQTFGTNSDAPQKMLFKKEQIVFSLQTLIEATGGFSSNNKLGQGGFGSVYKGVIQDDGQEIAVKKLSARSGQGTAEFMNEVEILANIQHRNLVKLLGCCVEGDERLLIYEFLSNKSLDTFLFDPMNSKQLDWQKRYNIIAGIARGLVYLHQDSRVRIIHRDIKANNILLDHNWNPKIADFGLARLFPDNEVEIQSRVAGTYGYMAPEYAMIGHLSIKADVYSFGVLLLEIVSGRKNTDIKEGQIFSLLEWAWRLYKQGNVLSIVDDAVAETCPKEEALRCIQVGLLCTQADADARPSMPTVVVMMSSNSEPLPNPKQPAFVSMGQNPTVSQNPCSSFTSITILEAR